MTDVIEQLARALAAWQMDAGNWADYTDDAQRLAQLVAEDIARRQERHAGALNAIGIREGVQTWALDAANGYTAAVGELVDIAREAYR